MAYIPLCLVRFDSSPHQRPAEGSTKLPITSLDITLKQVIHETIKRRILRPVNEHLIHVLFFSSQSIVVVRVRNPSRGGPSACMLRLCLQFHISHPSFRISSWRLQSRTSPNHTYLSCTGSTVRMLLNQYINTDVCTQLDALRPLTASRQTCCICTSVSQQARATPPSALRLSPRAS